MNDIIQAIQELLIEEGCKTTLRTDSMHSQHITADHPNGIIYIIQNNNHIIIQNPHQGIKLELADPNLIEQIKNFINQKSENLK